MRDHPERADQTVIAKDQIYLTELAAAVRELWRAGPPARAAAS